uniref:Anti-anti sigma factor protein n=1 Tax=Racemicystis crocea TaxID=1707966 RepID=A0A3S5GYN1_9BACT|nr:anti-anti sigma factor protein [Racemicystis crocea]
MSRVLPPVESFISITTLDALPHPAFVYRADGVLKAYNRGAEELYGIAREHVVNKFNAFESDILDKAIVEGIREALAGRTNVVYSALVDTSKSEDLASISQKTVWVENTNVPLCDAAGDVAYMLIMQRDVTEMTAQRAAIAEAKAEIAEQRELIASLERAQREIEEQRQTILALESPIIDVWDGVLLLPVIGAVTERRASEMMDKALSAVSAARARYLILDLTGSDHVDTTTANHFSSVLRAVALLGAQGIVVGIRPQVAQAMISLDLGLSDVRTYRNLREALRHCIRELRASGPRGGARSP